MKIRGIAAAWMVSAGLGAAQPVVTNVVIDAIGHSTARVTATSSVAPAGGERIRYGLTTGYETGAGGGLNNEGFGYCNNDPNFCPGIFQIYGTLSGLAPNALYHVQMQASTDGQNWGSSADATFTTLAAPNPDPAYPSSPETFDTSYPDTTAYKTVAAANCADLNAKLATAVNNRGSGWVITLAPGLFDTTSATCIQPPVDPSALPFTSAGVNTQTNQITVSGTLTAGEAIRFAPYYGSGACLPSSNAKAGGFCQGRGNIIQGVVYYVRNPIAAGASTTFQVSATAGGPAIALTDGGSATNFVVPVPAPGGPQIIIRTATPDSAFCPPGVRCMGAAWSSSMATIKVTGGLWSSVNGSSGPLVFQTNVGAHDIRLVGLEITQTDASALAAASTDPRPTYGLVFSNVADAPTRIIIDRCYIHGLGYPNRIYRPIVGFDGKYMALINSDLERWDYWRPWMDSGTPGTTGFAQTVTGNSVSTANGTYHMGVATCTTSGLTLTFTGGTVSGSNIAKSYLALNCTPTFVIPTGMTAVCAGTGSDGTNTYPCVVMTAATPDYARDPYGSYGCGPIAGITLTGGAPTAAGAETGLSIYNTEGTQGLIAGWGPGPFQMYNNYVEGAGLLWHWDDSSGGRSVGSGYVVQRNTFMVDPKYITGGPQSDGFDYEHRNGPEWKNGTNGLIDGNTFTNFFAAVSSEGCGIELTPRTAGVVSDFEVRNNTFTNGVCMVVAWGGLASGGQQQPQPFQRFWMHNNLGVNANGWTQFSAAARAYAIAYPLQIGLAMSDIIFEHNTIFNNTGPDPSFIHLVNNPLEGVVIRNNILWINNDHSSFGFDTEGFGGNVPQCNGFAEAGMNCAFVRGIGNTQYTFAQNVLVGYYANSQNSTGNVSPGSISVQWPGLPNLVTPGSNPQNRLKYIGFSNPNAGNFQLIARPPSPYLWQATDGSDVGINQLALQAAQGTINGVGATSITETTASVTFTPADQTGCAVDYSADPGFAGFTRVQSTTNALGVGGNWHADLSGLTANTQYYYRVLCPVQQPTGNFTTLP